VESKEGALIANHLSLYGGASESVKIDP
jgi:hypothetical protein